MSQELGKISSTVSLLQGSGSVLLEAWAALVKILSAMLFSDYHGMGTLPSALRADLENHSNSLE